MTKQAGHKRHWKKRAGLGLLIIVAGLLVAGRIYLPIWVESYVNTALNDIDGYHGSITDVDMHLYRGAYTIQGMEIYKNGDAIPAPFFKAANIDLSLEWRALFRRRIVGDVTLDRPVLNITTSESGTQKQTGQDTDWTLPVKALMPLDINYFDINNGKLTYKNFSTSPTIDLFIDNLEARATNLRNVEKKNTAMPSTITARGKSIGGGMLKIDGQANILKKIPDMDIKAQLESVDLPSLNDYMRYKAAIDVKTGTLNLYSQFTIKDAQLDGFLKPLITDLDMVDMAEQDTNPINALWESVVSVFVETFENQSKEQFATQVELTGTLNDPNSTFWPTFINIFRNAFGNAFSRSVNRE